MTVAVGFSRLKGTGTLTPSLRDEERRFDSDVRRTYDDFCNQCCEASVVDRYVACRSND